MRLSDIDWGADSAENDPHLLQYFYDSAAFGRISKKQKQLVVGRKGAGKSALRSRLKSHFEAQPNTYVISIAPQYTTIRSILNEGDLQNAFGQEIFFQHTWLRQILTDCLAAVGHDAKGKYATDSTTFAREVARQLNRTSLDMLENITEVLKRTKAKVGELGEFGLNLEKELRNIADVDALEHHALQIAAEGAQFVVMFDDLDQGWDNSAASNQLLLGLLRATTILNGKSANIFPVIFLREDVYALLMGITQHADKYRNIESIRWKHDQLIAVLTSRIEFNRGLHNVGPANDTFGSVFPETVGTSNTVNWLVERTLNRPRELLQLVRAYTESVDGAEPSDILLKAAESGYSTWKLTDLCSEFSNQYPGMQAFFAAWRSHFPRHTYHLRRSDLENVVITLLVASQINEHWFNVIAGATDVERMISILYEIGLIGDFVSGGAGGGARAHYSFEGNHHPRFDEVQIHPCFRRALDTAERIRKKNAAA